MTSFEHWIGKRVHKNSGKPFKSGLKTATVLGVIEHPQRRGKPAFVFHEDDSHVSCTQVHAIWDDVIAQAVEMRRKTGRPELPPTIEE